MANVGGDNHLDRIANEEVACGAVYMALYQAFLNLDRSGDVELAPHPAGDHPAVWVTFPFLTSRYRLTISLDPVPAAPDLEPVR